MTAQSDCLLDCVARGAGDVGDDDALKAGKGVEQAGLSGVRRAENGGLHAVFDEVAAAAGGKQRVELPGGRTQSVFIRLQAERLDVFVGVIEHRVKMRADIHELIVDRVQLCAQDARNLPGSIGGGVCRLGVDEVDDRLCLRQIHLSA